MRDQRVCRKHGGKAPQSLAAVERRRQERRALLAAETFGLPVERDPHTALLEELYRTVGAVEWLGAVVSDLDRSEVTWGKTETLDKQASDFPGTDTKHAASVNVWVELWQRERKHLVAVSKACIDAGIEERRVRLAESQGVMLATVIRSVVGALYEALVAAIGEHAASHAMIERLWPEWVSTIVPGVLRSVAVDGPG